MIYFDSLATTGFDPALDAYKLMNNSPGIPNLYSVMNHNLRLSINAMPINWNKIVKVPLGIEIDTTDEYQISAINIQNFPSDVEIFLVDTITGAQQNLNNKPTYTFSATPGFYESRFYLIFYPGRIYVTGVSQASIKNQPIVFANGNELNISNINGSQQLNVKVYNIAGQVVLDSKINANENKKYALNKGIYIVKTNSLNESYSKKIIIE